MRYPALHECEDEIENSLELIIDTYKNGGKVLVCGNGGSAADSEHIVGELMKGFMLKREVRDERIPEDLRNNLQGALPAISLPSQSAILSAYINDVEPDMMYAQLVYGYASEKAHMPFNIRQFKKLCECGTGCKGCWCKGAVTHRSKRK